MARPKKLITPGVTFDAKSGRWRWSVVRKFPDGTKFAKNGSKKSRDEAIATHKEVLELFEEALAAQLSPTITAEPVRVEYTLRTWANYAMTNIWPKPGGLAYNTIHNYELDLNRHIFSKPIADMPLKAISTFDIRGVLAQIGGSQHLQANLRNVLARLFKDAQQDGEYPEGRRPTDSISAARNHKERDEDGDLIETHRVLTEQEQKTLLAHSSSSWAYIGILIQLKTGLRSGEVCGLRRRDIQAGVLHVTGQLIRQKGIGLVRSATKTKSGLRSIPLPKSVLEALKSFGGKDYLLEDDGKLVDSSKYGATVSALMESAGINGTPTAPISPKASSHDLRHTFGSVAACKHNFPIKTLSEIMGHSNIATTLSLYVHADADDKFAAMSKFD